MCDHSKCNLYRCSRGAHFSFVRACWSRAVAASTVSKPMAASAPAIPASGSGSSASRSILSEPSSRPWQRSSFGREECNAKQPSPATFTCTFTSICLQLSMSSQVVVVMSLSIFNWLSIQPWSRPSAVWLCSSLPSGFSAWPLACLLVQQGQGVRVSCRGQTAPCA